MRVFKALIISLLVYALFIWLFVTQFSFSLQVPKKINNHVIKIDIRDIPTPKPPKKVIEKIVKKEALPPKKVEPKKVKKTQKIKKLVKKKVVQKKIIKKKSVKKPSTKKIVKKKTIKKEVIEEEFFYDEPIAEEIPMYEEEVVSQNKALEAFESEMVYIAEPMLKIKESEPTLDVPWSYPNDKVRKLYGSEFHQFTTTQKEFIEDNLETIQQITQRILTQRGYPQSAGRTGQEGVNVVSFNLHPNGDISDLRLKRRIGYSALDENTLSLIRVAYMDYPYPTSTTKIIFYVKYSLYGY